VFGAKKHTFQKRIMGDVCAANAARRERASRVSGIIKSRKGGLKNVHDKLHLSVRLR